MADPGKLPQDTFAVLCTMDDKSQIEVRKVSWIAETPPYYEVPEGLTDSKLHPHIIKYLNYATMKPGGRRNAKVVVYKTNPKTSVRSLTTAGSLYLNSSNQFVMNNQPLVKENAFNKSSSIIDYITGPVKAATADELLQKFSKFKLANHQWKLYTLIKVNQFC